MNNNEKRTQIKKDLEKVPFELLTKLKEQTNLEGGSTDNESESSDSSIRESSKRKRGNGIEKPSRPSKHAPTVMSSKKPISRKRADLGMAPDRKKIIRRDPRFDSLSGSLDTSKFEQAYSFLRDYKKDEENILKEKVKKSRNPEEKEKIQKSLERLESQRKSREKLLHRERIIREHKKKEREKSKENGKKKSFFLKNSQVKRIQLEEEFNAMSKRKVTKVIQKKKKKIAGKEKKMLPPKSKGNLESSIV